MLGSCTKWTFFLQKILDGLKQNIGGIFYYKKYSIWYIYIYNIYLYFSLNFLFLFFSCNKTINACIRISDHHFLLLNKNFSGGVGGGRPWMFVMTSQGELFEDELYSLTSGIVRRPLNLSESAVARVLAERIFRFPHFFGEKICEIEQVPVTQNFTMNKYVLFSPKFRKTLA